MRFNSNVSLLLSFVSSIIGFFLLFYFFLPFFIILLIGIIIYIAIVYIWAKVTGTSTNFNIKVVKIDPYKNHPNSQNVDSFFSKSDTTYIDNSIIDSTTTDKENKNKE